MTVLVLGSINMDLITYVPRLPAAGETLFGTSFITVPGGKGFNQAVAAGRLGATTRFFGRIGDDAFGNEVLAVTASEPVDMRGVVVDPAQGTGLAVISVDEAGENSIIVISGANMAHDDSDVTRCVAAMDDAQVLLLQLENPLDAALSAARAARERGLTVVLDPAPVTALPDEAYRLATIMTPNEVETEVLVGFRPKNADEATRAGEMLRERGVDIAIVKLGAQGVVWVSAESSGFMPAFTVNPIDTVAAGDSFNGGLAVALSEGASLPDAVRFAAAAGALATTRAGATSAMPYRAELDQLMTEQSNLAR